MCVSTILMFSAHFNNTILLITLILLVIWAFGHDMKCSYHTSIPVTKCNNGGTNCFRLQSAYLYLPDQSYEAINKRPVVMFAGAVKDS